MSEFRGVKSPEGINETKGAYSSPDNISAQMIEEAERINATLDGIKIPGESDEVSQTPPISEQEQARAALFAQLNFDARPSSTQEQEKNEATFYEEPIDNRDAMNNEATRQALLAQQKRVKELLDATKDAEPKGPEYVQLGGKTTSTGPREFSDEEIRQKIIRGILRLEDPSLDLNYVFLPDVIARFKDMSLEELRTYQDSLINQPEEPTRH